MAIISVIIPAYNAEKTIKETLESALNQSFRDLEVIVIDDGSTDKTAEIVSGLEDNRIRFFSYPNSGAQISRNRGIEKSTGDYLSFLDADDLWTPDKLEAQYFALQEHSDCAVAYSWTTFIDENGNPLPGGQRFRFQGQVYEQLLLGDFIGSGSNPLIRKEALLAVGTFDEAILGGQDWEMWLRLASQYSFTVVPRNQVLYRKSSTSWSSNIERQERGYKQVIDKCLSTAPEQLQKRRNEIIGNRYRLLTFDVLGRGIHRKSCWMAARYLWTAVRYQPRFLKDKVTWVVMVKIILGLVLPGSAAKVVLDQAKHLNR
ncbi:glycosyltransferase [Phormidium sp. FACHB-1136]|uniref:glycosyltransferase family 2 protein n=1 Tax=Phormidium sp. FACHB-1136 TaxID=2692848 RepID=UPI0016825488|nr:glycosyltransferase [Phormidium sp. FACHB-1136]MBD2425194.1 glycosyltransferase [Phormidium sp. FACHB-1136]